jgi:hypothetical protein
MVKVTMNECLLTKWIWKLVQGSTETWHKILEAKYMPDENFSNSKTRGPHNFGRGYKNQTSV